MGVCFMDICIMLHLAALNLIPHFEPQFSSKFMSTCRISAEYERKASVSEILHNLGWQSLEDRRQDQRLVLFYKILTVSRRLKRRTSSRLPTPVQGRITASNSNISRQIVIHIGTFFSSHYFKLEQLSIWH